MSYDVYLSPPATHRCNCTHCGYQHADTYDANYTSNVSGMWAKALGHPFHDLDGMRAAEAAIDLRKAVEVYKRDPKPFEAMNPENGWGDADGAFRFLEELAEACEDAPESTIGMGY